MVGHGRSSAGSYLADPTSPIPSHCASIVVTSTLRVKSVAFCIVVLHSALVTLDYTPGYLLLVLDLPLNYWCMLYIFCLISYLLSTEPLSTLQISQMCFDCHALNVNCCCYCCVSLSAASSIVPFVLHGVDKNDIYYSIILCDICCVSE